MASSRQDTKDEIMDAEDTTAAEDNVAAATFGGDSISGPAGHTAFYAC
jgi:hypothetical protein